MSENYYGVGTSMPGGSWLFEGIFSSEKLAVEAIEELRNMVGVSPNGEIAPEDMFVAYPVVVDDFYGSYDIYNFEVYYRPLRETKEEGLKGLMEYKKSVEEAY